VVDEEGDVDEALKGNIPPGDMVLYQRSVDPQTGAARRIPFLLKEKTLMTGEFIKDARVSSNQALVSRMWQWSSRMLEQSF